MINVSLEIEDLFQIFKLKPSYKKKLVFILKTNLSQYGFTKWD